MGKEKRSTKAKANNKTHLTTARAKERVREIANTRKTSSSPDKATAGGKTRKVSLMESATEGTTTGVLKRLSSAHTMLRRVCGRGWNVLHVAVTSGTTLRTQFIFWILESTSVLKMGFRPSSKDTVAHCLVGWYAQSKAPGQKQKVNGAGPFLPSHQRHTKNNSKWRVMLGQSEFGMLKVASKNNRNIVLCTKLQDPEVEHIIENCPGSKFLVRERC